MIANAGISSSFAPVASTALKDVKEHLAVNGIGPLLLFQSVLELLKNGSKFAIVNSAMGSIGAMETRPFPFFAYGASKAFANYLIRKIHFENEELVAFAIDPG